MLITSLVLCNNNSARGSSSYRRTGATPGNGVFLRRPTRPVSLKQVRPGRFIPRLSVCVRWRGEGAEPEGAGCIQCLRLRVKPEHPGAVHASSLVL